MQRSVRVKTKGVTLLTYAVGGSGEGGAERVVCGEPQRVMETIALSEEGSFLNMAAGRFDVGTQRYVNDPDAEAVYVARDHVAEIAPVFHTEIREVTG